MVQIGTCDVNGKLRTSFPDVAPEVANQLATLTERRIKELLNQLLGGYYYISAIRQQHEEEDAEKFPEAINRFAQRRYVGPSGEATFAAQCAFARNLMHEVHPTGSFAGKNVASYTFDVFVSRWLERLTGVWVVDRTTDKRVDISSDDALPTGWLACAVPVGVGESQPITHVSDAIDKAIGKMVGTGVRHAAESTRETGLTALSRQVHTSTSGRRARSARRQKPAARV